MPSDTEQIRAALATWQQAFNTKDRAGMAAVYTSDAVLLPPDMDPVEGLEAIEGFWGDFADSANSADLEIKEILVGGTLATLIVNFKLEVEGQTTEKGKSIEVWTRGEHGWRMHRDIWNNTP